MTAPGFAETIALNDTETGIVAVRRGEPASLRFPDLDGAEPLVRSRGEWLQFCASARAFAAAAETPPLFVALGDGRTAEVKIAPRCVEALIALLMRACEFSEGRG